MRSKCSANLFFYKILIFFCLLNCLCDKQVSEMDLEWESKLFISEERLSYLQSILPSGYNSKLIQYEIPTAATEAATFECAIKAAIVTKLDALKWITSFEKLSLTFWRSFKTYPEETARIVFKKDYRCHHNTQPKSRTAVPHQKHTNCSAKMKITIKQQSQKRSADKDLQTRPCEILLRFTHNHDLKSAAALKFRKPTEEVISIFHDLFNKGHFPSTAWQSYKFDLQVKYGNKYYKIAADGSVCPTRKWVFDLYYSLFKKEYGESTGDAMVVSLTKYIGEYNEKCGSTCATLLSNRGNLIICICDPFMKRIHENLSTSGEIMFIDSSGNMDRHSSRIFCLLCPSVAGALPLGIIITFSECEEVLSEALKALILLFPKRAFYGQGAPKIIITDDCAAERNALSTCFPNSQLLLCKFHVLQAAMRYFWDSKHKIEKTDRKEIYTIFHRLLHIKDSNLFKTNYEEALSNSLIKKYEFAHKYFLKMQFRASEWALCLRNTLITRGNDTNNYSEANFRVLKDIILKRTKAFSVVQLFSFLTVQLIDYYKRRLTDILNDRYEGYSQSKYYIPESKLTNLSYNKTADNIYIVKNSENESEYCVNIENSICSCSIGLQGAPCKHQYFVLKRENISSIHFMPKTDKMAKLFFHKILTGNSEVDDGWYNSLHHENDANFANKNSVISDAPCTSNNSNVFVVEKNEEEELQSAKANVKEIMRNIFCDLETLVESNPTEFIPALTKFSESYFKCKATSSKLSALHTFGHHSGAVGPLIKKGKNVQGGKSIPVQPTAVARRKAHLGGRQVQQRGRPPKRAYSSEHCYAKENANKKSKAAPHSLSFCVENNISLGQ